MTNYYSLLKISYSADSGEIEQAFIKFKAGFLKYNQGVKLTDEEIKMQCPDLWEAFETLLDPVKRSNYNELIRNIDFQKQEFHVQGSGASRSSRPGNNKSSKPAIKNSGYDPGIYIVKYSSPVLLTRITRIIAYVVFGISVIISIGLVLLFFMRMLPPAKDIDLVIRLVLLVILGLVMFFLTAFLKIIYPDKEILFKNGNFYICYANKPEEKITKLTLYKSRRKDIRFINADTSNEIVKFYCGGREADPYKLQMDRSRIMELAKKASVFVAEENFKLLKQAGLFKQFNKRK